MPWMAMTPQEASSSAWPRWKGSRLRRPVNVSESNEENNMININKLIANSINITTWPKLDEPLCFTAEEANSSFAMYMA